MVLAVPGTWVPVIIKLIIIEWTKFCISWKTDILIFSKSSIDFIPGKENVNQWSMKKIHTYKRPVMGFLGIDNISNNTTMIGFVGKGFQYFSDGQVVDLFVHSK